MWTCCSSILSLVEFVFFCFISVIIYLLLHKNEQRKIKIEPRIKLNYNRYTVESHHMVILFIYDNLVIKDILTLRC